MSVGGAFDERREASRFGREPEMDFAVVWLSPYEEHSAAVRDESLGGACVVMDDVSRLVVGGEVGFAYRKSFVRAKVKHVRPLEDGAFLVGLEFDECP